MKTICKAIMLFAFFSIQLIVQAQAYGEEMGRKYNIDKKLEKCMHIDSSTPGIADCNATAEKDWDRELNKVYGFLMKKLKPIEKETLTASQKNWLAYQNKEIKFLQETYFKRDGTFLGLCVASRKMRMIRFRTIELALYSDELFGDNGYDLK